MARMWTLVWVLVAVMVQLGAAQEWALTRLEQSPRHLEWVVVKHGDRSLNAFVAYPEVKDKATAVVVIHEIFGLTDWVRGVADQLAEAGFIAIAPICFPEQLPTEVARVSWAPAMPCDGPSVRCRPTRSRRT